MRHERTGNWDVLRRRVSVGAISALLVVAGTALVPGAAEAAITCNGLTPTITGTSNAETLTGTAGNDVIAGLGGDDTIDGGAGNDTLCGGPGTDSITGGSGGDRVSYVEAGVAVNVNLGSGTATGEGTDTLNTVEHATGSGLADTLTGGPTANSLKGSGGADLLIGGAGNDTLDGGASTDKVSYAATPAPIVANLASKTATGDGSDTLNAVEQVVGSGFDDTLTGSSAANSLWGGVGNDVLDGGKGNDTLLGEAGTDTATYATATSTVTGNLTAGTASSTSHGSDTLSAVERLVGSPSADVLTGGPGPDTIQAGAGNDVVDGAGNNDTLDGGAGVDAGSFATSPAAITASLATGSATGNGADTLTGFEDLIGSPQDDGLTGGATANVLAGGLGNDTLNGGGGLDTASYARSATGVNANLATLSATGEGTDTFAGIENLDGSTKNDTLTGDAGPNVLSGRGGVDLLDGAGGTDTASYAVAPAVTASLTTGQATGDGTDTFTAIENLTGSPNDDTLIGNAGPNVLDGGAGTDVCTLNAGGDTATRCEIGDSVLTAVGAQHPYIFTAAAGDKVFLDFHAAESCTLRWTLTGPGGDAFTDQGFCADRGELQLPVAGTYTLKVRAPSFVSTYRFRWWKVPAPQVFPYTVGSIVSNGAPANGAGNLETPAVEDHYTFTATAGEKVYVNCLSTPSGYVQWSLTGPGGPIFTDKNLCGDQGPFTLAAGTHTLVVTTVPNSDVVGTYGFQITDVPPAQTFTYTVGTTVSDGTPSAGQGNLELPGAEDRYTFISTAGEKIYVNCVTTTTGYFQWSLTGPGGPIFTDKNLCADQGPFTLAAGAHTLSVRQLADNIGTYSFRITDVPAAQTFAYTMGTTVSNGAPSAGAGNLELPGAEDRYTFSAAAGEKIYLNCVTAESGYFQWSLTGPGGAVFTDKGLCSDQGPFTLAAGAHTLTLKQLADNLGTYSFRITDVPAPQTFAYTMGTTVSDGVPSAGQGNLELPGAEDRYTFTATAGEKIFVNCLGAGSAYFLWSLNGPGGAVFTDRSLCADQGPLTLAAGTHTLIVKQLADVTGTYSFRITDVPAPQTFAYTIGTTVNGDLPVPRAEHRYTFNGTSGQRILVDCLSTASAAIHWTLTGPSGAAFTDRAMCADQGPFTLAAGSYTLSVFGTADISGAYSFKVTVVP